jgi:hypothetical protein
MLYNGNQMSLQWAKTVDLPENQWMSFGKVSFSLDGAYIMACSELDRLLYLVVFQASNGTIVNARSLKSNFPYHHHKSILMAKMPTTFKITTTVNGTTTTTVVVRDEY